MNENIKVLIVDDEDTLRAMYSKIFTNRGYEVLNAKNGQEALDIAFAQKPTVIILDLQMPVMDGMTALSKLREDEWGESVPVIILTGTDPGTSGILQGVTKGKPAYYLVKSTIRPKQVVEKAEELINLYNEVAISVQK